jgi:hypothetical protein
VEIEKADGKARTTIKKPRIMAGLLSYFGLIDLVMRSSSFKNSAVSSSFGLEGGLRKGITSDIGSSPDASDVLLGCNCRISAAGRFFRFCRRHNYFQFDSVLAITATARLFSPDVGPNLNISRRVVAYFAASV